MRKVVMLVFVLVIAVAVSTVYACGPGKDSGDKDMHDTTVVEQ